MDKQLVDVSASVTRMAANDEVSNHDDLSRRIKNRERQRRYRERKRLLADLKKAHAIDISVPPPLNLSYEETPQHLTRVFCQRDWKKDARRAHLLIEQGTGPNASCFQETELANKGQKTSPTPPGFSNTQLCNGYNLHDETRKYIPSRRHWKVDARNKKS